MKHRSVVPSFILASLLAIVPIIGQAQIEDFAYAGIGIGKVSVPNADDSPFQGTETSPGATNIYGGVWLTDTAVYSPPIFIGMEVGYMQGTKGDVKVNNNATSLKYEVDSFYAAAIARYVTDRK